MNKQQYDHLVYTYGKERADDIVAKQQQRVAQEKQRLEQQAVEQARKKEEREKAHQTLKQATATIRQTQRLQWLELYVSDIEDKNDRDALFEMVEATRAAFLEQ